MENEIEKTERIGIWSLVYIKFNIIPEIKKIEKYQIIIQFEQLLLKWKINRQSPMNRQNV